jgi:hypothetical protein
LNKAIRIVIGINNSTTFTLIAIIPKNRKQQSIVCPIVNSVTRRTILFQSLKVKGIANAIKKTKHDRTRMSKTCFNQFESKSKTLT